MSRKKKDQPSSIGPTPTVEEDLMAETPPPSTGAEPDEQFSVEYGAPQEEPPCSPNEKIAQLEAELAMAQDRTLRCAAELENFKKRVARETADERRYASLPLMRDILPVLDNMGRAIESVEQGHDPSCLLDGVKMVTEQLKGVLAKYDCVEINALNQSFDPHRHEAILQQPSSEVAPHTVLAVNQAGYQLHDRVVRPSTVIVSKEAEEE